jgi:hypothetical protein
VRSADDVRGATCEAGGRAFRPGAPAKSDHHGEHEDHEEIIRLFFTCFMSFMVNALEGVRGARSAFQDSVQTRPPTDIQVHEETFGSSSWAS